MIVKDKDAEEKKYKAKQRPIEFNPHAVKADLTPLYIRDKDMYGQELRRIRPGKYPRLDDLLTYGPSSSHYGAESGDSDSDSEASDTEADAATSSGAATQADASTSAGAATHPSSATFPSRSLDSDTSSDDEDLIEMVQIELPANLSNPHAQPTPSPRSIKDTVASHQQLAADLEMSDTDEDSDNSTDENTRLIVNVKSLCFSKRQSPTRKRTCDNVTASNGPLQSVAAPNGPLHSATKSGESNSSLETAQSPAKRPRKEVISRRGISMQNDEENKENFCGVSK